MSNSVCPLCSQAKHMNKAKPLYGVPVCKRCYYKFANRRQLAYVVDWVVWNFAAFFLGMGLGLALLALNASNDTVDIAAFVFGWLVFPLIFFCKDGFVGHSPGKALTGVQAVHPKTLEPIGFGSSFKRNLPLLIPFMPLIIAFLLQRGYRIGDHWARSKVIWKRYANHPLFTGRMACERCQYDLTGNSSGVCPECGSPVASLDPRILAPPVAQPV